MACIVKYESTNYENYYGNYRWRHYIINYHVQVFNKIIILSIFKWLNIFDKSWIICISEIIIVTIDYRVSVERDKSLIFDISQKWLN